MEGTDRHWGDRRLTDFPVPLLPKPQVVRHRKAENLNLPECGRKFDVLPKLVQQWEKQYEAGQLTQAAGRRSVSPEQAEITRLRAELSRARMEVSILKKAAVYFAKESQ